jgi:hypothetical protein
MTKRMKYSAEYLYPGAFFPESMYRELAEPTFSAAVDAEPDSGWYAVKITTTTQKMFTAGDGDVTWVDQESEKESWIVGEKIHYTQIPNTEENGILRRNIEYNDPDGFGVRTRLGNWQPAGAYDHVVSA